jgi:hypothetical protein
MLIGSMELHGHLALDGGVRARLLRISAATIDRVFAPMRAQSCGSGSRVCRGGSCRHSGPVTRGSFIQTLVLTDVASGWTECASLLFREQTLLREVLNAVSRTMPFPLAGFDTDTDDFGCRNQASISTMTAYS